MKIEFVKYNKVYLMITLALVTFAIVAIGIWGLKLGIDFSGGTIIEYNLVGKPEVKDIETKLQGSVKKISKIILSGDTYSLYFEPLKDTDRDSIEADIVTAYPNSKRVAVETISSSVGVEQSKSALLSILFASIGIIVFLTISFKKVTSPFKSWEFGVSAVIALLHDAIIVLGAFSVLGHFFGAEIDLLFITAILTVIGFSVHDTIVVFDRIRENIIKYGS
ncbi:MAG: protein translocase subunit SecF, partial [bacterium]